jgi:hypothetical protein
MFHFPWQDIDFLTAILTPDRPLLDFTAVNMDAPKRLVSWVQAAHECAIGA